MTHAHLTDEERTMKRTPERRIHKHGVAVGADETRYYFNKDRMLHTDRRVSHLRERLTAAPAETPTHRCIGCKREHPKSVLKPSCLGGARCPACGAECVKMAVIPKPPQDAPRLVTRERLRKAISENAIGVPYADLYANKKEAIDDRYAKHDCNFPYKSDVDAAVDALLSADLFRVVSEEEIAVILEKQFRHDVGGHDEGSLSTCITAARAILRLFDGSSKQEQPK